MKRVITSNQNMIPVDIQIYGLDNELKEVKEAYVFNYDEDLESTIDATKKNVNYWWEYMNIVDVDTNKVIETVVNDN